MTIGNGHNLKSQRFAGEEILEACYDNERALSRGDSGPAIKKVQEARGLRVDGVVGSETIGSLDNEFYFGPSEPPVAGAPEPHVSDVRTPLEPESPVQPAKAPWNEPPRAPELPHVQPPEVTGIHAPPVPRPEVPTLAAEPHQREHRPTYTSRPSTPPTTIQPNQTDSQGRLLIAEGTWRGDRYLEAEAGKSIHFKIIGLNVDGSKVCIRADTGETKDSALSPGVTVDFDFSREGEEPFIWKFDIETDSSESLIDWKLYSNLVPHVPLESRS